MRVLVAGRAGQLATELLRALPEAGHAAVALGRPELDLARPATVRAALDAHAPDAVVNAAAWTAVDRAEDERDAAFAVNRDGVARLAKETARRGIPVLHVSTDYVFAGDKPGPYAEDDATGPTGVYGHSKLAGEIALASANPRSVVVRTAWVCSAHGQNFLRTMLRLAETKEEVGVVADQHGAPTFADDLADALTAMLPRLAAAPAGDAAFGTFHLTGAPHTTWHGFAEAIFEGLAARGLKAPRLRPIRTVDYPTRARRPANSRLSCARIGAVHGITPADWRVSLDRCLTALTGRARTTTT